MCPILLNPPTSIVSLISMVSLMGFVGNYADCIEMFLLVNISKTSVVGNPFKISLLWLP